MGAHALPTLEEPGIPHNGEAPSLGQDCSGVGDSTRTLEESGLMLLSPDEGEHLQDTIKPPPCCCAYAEDIPDDKDISLTAKQSCVIDMVCQRMSAAERDCVDTRNVNISFMPSVDQATSEESEQHTSPSCDKGKGPDPRNLGAAELSGDEYDPNIQRQILEAVNALKEQCNATNKLPEPQSVMSSSPGYAPAPHSLACSTIVT
ncbi:hypothetical protein DXG01_004137 [Tephrocybe rancida]|nr:hypothetical protein DXG01_004137 [Tephrocybe rancida]